MFPEDGLVPSPTHQYGTGGCGTLPFIHKLLEVLGEDTTGQLRRRLWEGRDRWESDAHDGSGIGRCSQPRPGEDNMALGDPQGTLS